MNSIDIGFSPCPNDTFIFDAMINGRIDTEGIIFKPYVADVEELNQKAFSCDLLVTKLSYFAYAFLNEKYVALGAGSALGSGCGPLLVCKKNMNLNLNLQKIAIPGIYTTANLLLGLAHPEAKNKHEMLFTKIEDAILSGQVDSGVIIHENRFTFEERGLIKRVDLGQWWEKTSGMPIPLGGIFIRRDTPTPLRNAVNRVLKNSVRYALKNPEASRSFTMRYADELEESVIDQHIKLYVNHFSVDLGDTGKQAVTTLFDYAVKKKIIPAPHPQLFI